MKQYKLLKDFLLYKVGEIMSCDVITVQVGSGAVFYKPEDFPHWFEEIKEEIEYCDTCLNNFKEYGHMEGCSQEDGKCNDGVDMRFHLGDGKEKCLQGKNECKQKPSEWINDRMWELLGDSYWDYDIEPMRLRATIEYLDEHFSK